MTCTRCGHNAIANAVLCARCGAPIEQAAASAVAVPETRPSIDDSALATRNRSALSATASVAEAPAEPTTVYTRVVPPAATDTGAAWVSEPTVDTESAWPPPASTTPPTRPSVVPPEVRIVAAGLVVLALLITYPFFEPLPDLIGGLFDGDKLTRGISSFVLAIVGVIFAAGAALVLLAIGLVRGRRVAQWLTVVVAALTAISEIAAAQREPTVFSTPPDDGVVAGVIICAALIVALLTVPSRARTFFAADTRPIGVLIAGVANTYIGAVLLFDALFLILAAGLDSSFAAYGVAFGVAGATLLATSTRLRAGNRTARAVCVAFYAALVVVLLLFAEKTDQTGSLSTLMPLGIAVFALFGLTLAPSSQALFAGSSRDSE